MSAEDPIASLERAAEVAYADMYDAPPRAVKDCYENARSLLLRAREAAERAGRMEIARRLDGRLAHIAQVYDSQFRGVGW